MTHLPSSVNLQVGVGLRHQHIADALNTSAAIDFVEVHSENFFAQGGALHHLLQDVADAYPVSLHSTAMGLGSAAGIPGHYLQQLARLARVTQPMMMSDHAVEALLTISPPQQGDWARWGAGLADLLRDMPELEDYPFVADVAHLDYHCHQLVRDADMGIDFPSLMLLKSDIPEELSITLNPQLTLMQSNFPIAQIRQAHQHQCELRSQALRNALRDKAEYYYSACYRNGLEVLVRSLTELEFNWLTTLQRTTLGDALSAFEQTEFSFQHWLTGAIQTGLLHKIQIHV